MIAGNDLIDSVDPVQLSIRLLVPPGSLLLELPEMREHLLGYDPEGFSHLWQHPDPVMDALQNGDRRAGCRRHDAGVSRVRPCGDPPPDRRCRRRVGGSLAGRRHAAPAGAGRGRPA